MPIFCAAVRNSSDRSLNRYENAHKTRKECVLVPACLSRVWHEKFYKTEKAIVPFPLSAAKSTPSPFSTNFLFGLPLLKLPPQFIQSLLLDPAHILSYQVRTKKLSPFNQNFFPFKRKSIFPDLIAQDSPILQFRLISLLLNLSQRNIGSILQ